MKKRTFILLVSLFLCVGVLVVCLGDFIFLLGDQMVVRTIEEKCDGVGEAFQADLSLGGVWVNNPVDANLAYFQGFVDPSMPFDDLGRWLFCGIGAESLTLSFRWENGHWVATQKYLTPAFEVETLTVYTDANHDVWLFEFDTWEACAPFGDGSSVRDIFKMLNLLGEG